MGWSKISFMRFMFVLVEITAARFCNAPSSGAYSLEATSKNIKNSGISISPRINSAEPTSATVAIPNFNISVEETTKSAVPSSVIMCRFST